MYVQKLMTQEEVVLSNELLPSSSLEDHQADKGDTKENKMVVEGCLSSEKIEEDIWGSPVYSTF